MSNQNPFFQNVAFAGQERRDRMKENILILCPLLFIGCLFVADTTGIKLFSYSLFGLDFMIPASTLAFSMTFLATDVLCEVTGGRSFANRMIALALTLRILELCYYHAVIGDSSGHIPFFALPSLWTPVKQEHLSFVLGAGVRFAFAGLCATFCSFLFDTYVFSYLRTRWLNRNLYWLRNGAVTTLAQIINSTIYITIAFGNQLGFDQILMTMLGQLIIKFAFAWLDTPLALLLRNYGQGRLYWYAFWKRDFYLG